MVIIRMNIIPHTRPENHPFDLFFREDRSPPENAEIYNARAENNPMFLSGIAVYVSKTANILKRARQIKIAIKEEIKHALNPVLSTDGSLFLNFMIFI